MDEMLPTLAIITNGYTPYGTHLFLRIALEIPQIRLATIYTHDYSMQKWSLEIPHELSPVRFGIDEHANNQNHPFRIAHEWRKAGKIISWLAKNKVQAVIQLSYNDAGRLRIIHWCKRNNIPLFILGDSNINCDSVRGIKAKIKQFLLPRILANCAGVMPFGRLGKAYFEKYGVNSNKIFQVPNEPDYRLIQQITPEQISEIRTRYGLESNRRRIVFSGRLVGEKRVDLLLAAFNAIAEARPDWDLVIIGDGPLAAELRRQIPETLQSRVIWTGFIDGQASISAIYHACDVLVLPSDFEPWALVINEAVAAGLAVICSDVVGAGPELVEEGVNGWIFPSGNLEKLTHLLLQITDKERIGTMRLASKSVLQAWREKSDPVEGVRQALRYCGVL